MLAYRHAFHAGNHADVLKHLVLLMVLQHLLQKEKGLRYIDTHAGAGGYSLHSAYARKTSEYAQGIARLWSLRTGGQSEGPAPVSAYLDLVQSFNGGAAELRQYPGSPAVAHALLREQDEMHLMEMHATDHRILASWLDSVRSGSVMLGDGFDLLKAKLPPPSRRALVLMDPSYELERDYARVVQSLRDALQRFSAACCLVWYPQVGRVEAAQLPRRLKALAPKSWVHARLSVQAPDAQGFGLQGSGVFVINPPHTLHAQLQQLLPWLRDQLAQHDQASWLLEQHAA